MGKVIAAINMTLDGICDHTAGIADDELHQHYNDLLKTTGIVLYGRITYQLMEYWPTVVKNPTGNKATDEFAVTMDNIPKIVFSTTLKSLEWKSAKLATGSIKEEVLKLKQQNDDDILVGSRSLIIAALNLNLIDEFQLCIHPVVAGTGLQLFENINAKTKFKLLNTKIFKSSGAITLYYEPVNLIN